MPPLPESHPTAVAAAWYRLRRRAWRSGLFVTGMSGVIALLLIAVQGGGAGRKFVYSLAIGMTCWITHEALRLAWAAGLDAWHAWRGESTACGTFAWHGVWQATALSIVIGPVLGTRLGDVLTGYRTPSLADWANSDSRTTLALTLIGSLVAVLVLSGRERLQAAQRQAAENQLRLLQSQLEPHMLFNTLANLRVLIGLDPARAQAMLDRLIAFLRSTLAASRADRHPLQAEFDRTADYLALMAVRMGPRLASRLDLPPELAALPVPPLLLQPLVENAVQHGLEPKVEGGLVSVAAAREGGTLVLTVADTGAGPGAGTPGTGFGLAQVKERLATLYGARASVEAGPAEGGGFRCTIRMPLP